MHVRNHVDAVLGVVCALRRKCQNIMPHVAYIVLHAGLIRRLQVIVDEVHTRLCVRHILLQKIARNTGPQCLLVLEACPVDHFLVLLQRKTRSDRSNGNIIAFG